MTTRLPPSPLPACAASAGQADLAFDLELLKRRTRG